MLPPPSGLRNGRVRPHTCHRCQDVFPGEREEILVSRSSSWNAPIDEYKWESYVVNRLNVVLADLRTWREEGCEFACVLGEQIEKYGKFKNDVAVAVHLFTNASTSFWLLEGLVHLASLRGMQGLPVGIDGEKCYVTEVQLSCYVTAEEGETKGCRVPVTKGMACDPLSSETISSIRAWLALCEDQAETLHKPCSVTETPCIPRRLISLDKRGLNMRLRLINDHEIHTQHGVRYAALSYCWGGPQEKQLTRANLISYTEKISWHTLPKTLQDAAIATYQIGLHYLWIDSLCIIQDDDDDKSTAIGQMTKIYTHAIVTILDRRGSKAADGFLHPRSALRGSTYVRYENERGVTSWATLYFDKSVQIRDAGQLDSRGWTLQEQILSRRQLSFGPRCTEWSCRGERAKNKDGWRGPPADAIGYGSPLVPFEIQDKFAGARTTPFADNGLDFEDAIDAVIFSSVNPSIKHKRPTVKIAWEEWVRLIDDYSQRSLTVSKDRVFAIAGVAESFVQCFSDSPRYIAGIWEFNLPGALLWRCPKRSKRSDRPPGYHGPTWSWVSIEDEISQDIFSEESTTFLCTMPSTTYELGNCKSPFGAVLSASLNITGPAIGVEWRCVRHQNADSTHDINEFRWNASKVQADWFYSDAREHSTDWTEASLLCIAYNYNMPVGLVLLRCRNHSGHVAHGSFRRLGYFGFHYSSGLPYVKEWSIGSFCIV